MKPHRLTKPQQRGLEFFDLSERDPIRLMGCHPPATKTTNWLVKNRFIDRQPVGQFDLRIYALNDKGRAALRGEKNAETADVR
jgi:hypothetical protein